MCREENEGKSLEASHSKEATIVFFKPSSHFPPLPLSPGFAPYSPPHAKKEKSFFSKKKKKSWGVRGMGEKENKRFS